MMMFLIERSECDDDYDWQIRIWWWWCCCWSKGQSVDDDIADREFKVLKMLLLIERSRCWRCCCWLKSQSAEDVADRKDKMLKMLLLIEKLKCWRCCWSKGQSAEDVGDRSSQRINDDEDWRLKMNTTWCWKASNDLYMCYPTDVDDVPYLYSCCCWCCCRIPFSLRGIVEIL